jgi:hypothetical protein
MYLSCVILADIQQAKTKEMYQSEDTPYYNRKPFIDNI